MVTITITRHMRNQLISKQHTQHVAVFLLVMSHFNPTLQSMQRQYLDKRLAIHTGS